MKLYKEKPMVLKSVKRTMFASKKIKMAVACFMKTPETKNILTDPKERRALIESTTRIRGIAKARQEAKKIPSSLRSSPCTI